MSGGGCCGCSAGSARPAARWPRCSAGTWCSSTVTGLVAGAAAGAVTLLAVTRAVTGSWTPFIPLAPAVGLVAAVAAITAGAVMIPFGVMSRREPTLASG